MVNGYGVCDFLWYLYAFVFQVSAYDSTQVSFGGAITLYDNKLYYVHGRMRYCGVGCDAGQLAVQYYNTGGLNAVFVLVGGFVFVSSLFCPKWPSNLVLGFLSKKDYNPY